MSKIIVVGGGFAGVSALNVLARFKDKHEILLIDKKKTFDFLPMLPDVIGRGLKPNFLVSDLEKFAKGKKCSFIKSEINGINFEKRIIKTQKNEISFDYLIIAVGTQTNFYGNDKIKRHSLKLDSAKDSEILFKRVQDGSIENFVIGGGGYTGIEIATNLRRLFSVKRMSKRILIVERAPTLLGPLPEWMKQYTINNLGNLNIDIKTNCVIESIEENNISLSTGENLTKALLIWTAGVRIPDFISDLELKKNPQGRIEVDKYLKINNSCFVAGDAAFFLHNGVSVRMGVQFAIIQGALAAKNIISTIAGRPLRKYYPRDLGYVIPMANNRSCGAILGVKSKGFVATLLHYLMCIYRTMGFKNKFGIIGQLFKKRRV